MLGKLLADVAELQIGAAGQQPRKVGGHGADRRRDRHVVVIENDDKTRVHRAGVVHRLIGHASRHRAVADHGDHVVGVAAQVARHRHAKAGGDRRRSMRRAEGVVFAFRALGEARQAAARAKRADAVTASGENLVGVRLMTDVPDQPVTWRVEDMMQCNGQLDHAETGAQMAARHRNRVDGLLPHLIGNLPEVRRIMLTQITRVVDGIKHCTSSLLVSNSAHGPTEWRSKGDKGASLC